MPEATNNESTRPSSFDSHTSPPLEKDIKSNQRHKTPSRHSYDANENDASIYDDIDLYGIDDGDRYFDDVDYIPYREDYAPDGEFDPKELE